MNSSPKMKIVISWIKFVAHTKQLYHLRRLGTKKLYGHYNDIFMVKKYIQSPFIVIALKKTTNTVTISLFAFHERKKVIWWTILLTVWWNFWSMFYKLKKFDQAQCQTGESKSYNQITFTFGCFRELWLWSYSSFF